MFVGALRSLRDFYTLYFYGNGLDRVSFALFRRLRVLVLFYNRVVMLGVRDLVVTSGFIEFNLVYNRLVSVYVYFRVFRRLRVLRSFDLVGN